MAVMHLPIKFGADIFIQSGVMDIFPKSKMAPASILDFQVMWIWPFQHVDGAVCVFSTKFGSNICYSHWDRHINPSEIHLMTSHKLTSGFDFWSPDHLRMAVMHLPIKFSADIFIQSVFFLFFLFGVTHAPFACQRWGLPHRLAQCATPGKGLV